MASTPNNPGMDTTAAAAPVSGEQEWIQQEDPDCVVEYDFPPLSRQYKSGHVVRYGSADNVPAGTDVAGTGVSSRDVVINPSSGLWARLYLLAPPAAERRDARRLPMVVYYHGSAFVAGSAAGRTTRADLNKLAADSNVLIVSPEYRLAPEHPPPTAFDDSWEALGWVASHASPSGDGMNRDPWLAEHGDLERVFLCGASAGATIAHNMAARAGADAGESHGLPGGVLIEGLLVVHPFFAGEKRIGSEPADRAKAGAFWRFRCPDTPGLDDPLRNPFSDDGRRRSPAARVACERVLVCVAEKDGLRDRGVWYYEGLKASGCPGEVALHESMGVDHVFHYADSDCEQAVALHARVLDFLR